MAEVNLKKTLDRILKEAGDNSVNLQSEYARKIIVDEIYLEVLFWKQKKLEAIAQGRINV